MDVGCIWVTEVKKKVSSRCEIKLRANFAVLSVLREASATSSPQRRSPGSVSSGENGYASIYTVEHVPCRLSQSAVRMQDGFFQRWTLKSAKREQPHLEDAHGEGAGGPGHLQITEGRGSKRSPHGIIIAHREEGGAIHRWSPALEGWLLTTGPTTGGRYNRPASLVQRYAGIRHTAIAHNHTHTPV
ncbi:PDZ domain-containing protein 2 [Lates japonicus]|uniref:PDZ domain-containing protein 2 n=1 Tax=Lates japonicus TaxID=270547 RepID=A0AAD3NKZ6_LATJO|nr:PDZ domain-containing protein 2 [Lates japonicus]